MLLEWFLQVVSQCPLLYSIRLRCSKTSQATTRVFEVKDKNMSETPTTQKRHQMQEISAQNNAKTALADIKDSHFVQENIQEKAARFAAVFIKVSSQEQVSAGLQALLTDTATQLLTCETLQEVAHAGKQARRIGQALVLGGVLGTESGEVLLQALAAWCNTLEEQARTQVAETSMLPYEWGTGTEDLRAILESVAVEAQKEVAHNVANTLGHAAEQRPHAAERTTPRPIEHAEKDTARTRGMSYTQNSNPVAKSASQKKNRRAQILTIFQEKDTVTVKDIAEYITDCSEKTLQRELVALTKQGVLKKYGERRWSRYALA